MTAEYDREVWDAAWNGVGVTAVKPSLGTNLKPKSRKGTKNGPQKAVLERDRANATLIRDAISEHGGMRYKGNGENEIDLQAATLLPKALFDRAWWLLKRDPETRSLLGIEEAHCDRTTKAYYVVTATTREKNTEGAELATATTIMELDVRGQTVNTSVLANMSDRLRMEPDELADFLYALRVIRRTALKVKNAVAADKLGGPVYPQL